MKLVHPLDLLSLLFIFFSLEVSFELATINQPLLMQYHVYYSCLSLEILLSWNVLCDSAEIKYTSCTKSASFSFLHRFPSIYIQSKIRNWQEDLPRRLAVGGSMNSRSPPNSGRERGYNCEVHAFGSTRSLARSGRSSVSPRDGVGGGELCCLKFCSIAPHHQIFRMDTSKRKENPNPWDTASSVSRLFHLWVQFVVPPHLSPTVQWSWKSLEVALKFRSNLR